MKQTLREYNTDITGCVGCAHYKRTMLFDLCTHEESIYVTALKDFHTCQHMRERHVGKCGPDKKLRQ